jgi:hypothetical protein
MQVDALSIAFEIAEPSVPAATAIPDAIMPRIRAYSVADAPPSSHQKRENRPADLHIEYLPHNERSGCAPLQTTYQTPVLGASLCQEILATPKRGVIWTVRQLDLQSTADQFPTADELPKSANQICQ